MRVLVFNPNSTARMTEGIVASARAAAATDMEIVGRTNAGAPPAIQGAEDGAAATPGVVAAMGQAAAEGFDAGVIACFDDTGLAEARAVVGIPVIGIGQAAFLAATLYGRFSVMTTLSVSVPVISDNIARYGFSGACEGVYASGIPVLQLEEDPDGARNALTACAREISGADRSAAIVLGCAGMTAFGRDIQAASGRRAIDGVASAIGLARTILKATA